MKKLLRKLSRRAARWYFRNFYEAAEASRLRPKRVDRRTADQQIQYSQPYLLDRARHLDQNSDIFNAVTHELHQKVFGANGLIPEFQVKLKNGQPATAVNDHFARLFERWSKDPFVDGEDSYASGQALMGHTFFRDGEVFCVKHTGRVEGLKPVVPEIPLWLEMVESEDCPDYNEPSQGIVQGVQKNQWRRPQKYYFRKREKENYLWRSHIVWSPDQLIARPAEMVNHIKVRKRIHQTRGVTYFASVLNRVTDVAEIDETERAAARVAASIAMQITKGSPDDYKADLDGEDREFEVAPGMVYDKLMPGEKIELIDSSRPNPDLVSFRDSQLRNVAGGTNTAYSAISRNYGDLSYSAARQERLEGLPGYRFLSNFWIDRQERDVVGEFIRFAWLTLPVRWQNEVDQSTLFDISHTLPGIGYLNPLQEVQADLLAISGGKFGVPLTSWQKVVKRRGDNPQEILEQLIAQQSFIPEIQNESAENETNQETTSDQEPVSNLRVVK